MNNFRSDGNGGFYISKSALATIAVMLALASIVIGLATQAFAFKSNIDDIEHTAEAAVADNALVHPIVIQNNKDLAVMTEKVDNIDKNVEKILKRMED